MTIWASNRGAFTGEVAQGAMNRATVGMACAVLLLLCGCAELGLPNPLGLPGLSGGQALDEATVADGLRAALDVGADDAVKALSKQGGFSDSPLLRIPLPEELDGMAATFRQLGFGAQVDELELKMNRAAERATAEALPVLTNAVRELTVEDAFEILRGSETAATDYFKRKTGETLRTKFEPVVEGAMREVGVYSLYAQAIERYDMIPFTKPPAPNLTEFVTDRTVDGLFSMIAVEESRIREDPVARTSALLRRVFGSPEAQSALAP